MAISVACATGTGQINRPYSSPVVASGGVAPYTYALTSGSLPPGLTLAASTGVISGTPTTAGSYNFTVQATDSASATGSTSCGLYISGWLSRNDFTGSDYVQASDLNNLHDDIVTWGGNVNGGGYTLSNVVLVNASTQASSGVSSFNNRTGAVVPLGNSQDYTAAMVGAVPTTVQVIAGPGLSGGGALSGNVTLTADMLSVNGRKGAVILTSSDIMAASGVVQASSVNTPAGSGLQGGGTLAATNSNTIPASLNLSVIPGDPSQQIQFQQGSQVVATRHIVNFISGANVTVAVNDAGATANRVDVTVSSTGGGTGMVDPTTTKGDLLVRGPTVVSRLAVAPTDGWVLTAASGTSLGVQWAAAPGNAVSSVFKRTGAVAAGQGDYTAAQVTNAVDVSQTYSDATGTLMWITGLNWSKILGAPAFLMDPTTTKGDLIVHGPTTTRLPLGGDGTVLMADSTTALGVKWGATSAVIPSGSYSGDMLVWQQAGGWGILPAAGQPAAVGNVLTVQSTGASTKLAWQAPPPQQPVAYSVNGTPVASTFGLNIVAGNNTTITGATGGSGSTTNITITAGGPTSGLSDPTTNPGDLIVRGASQITRLGIGTDGMVLMADSTVTGILMRWATVATGGGGAQTPWQTNIDANNKSLSNIPVIQGMPASNLIINAPGSGGSISLQADGTTMAAISNAAGVVSWGALTSNTNPTNSNPPAVILTGSGTAQWNITGTAAPTTPGTNLLTFQCLNQSAGVFVMNDLGRFGVGVATPAWAVDVAGNVNCTGLYRINGNPLAAAQVVNAVSSIGSYADPAWITSLSYSKLTGVPAAPTQFWQAGAAGAIYYNGGPVGIGVTAPVEALDVGVSNGINAGTYRVGATSDGGYTVQLTSAGGNSYLDYLGTLNFRPKASIESAVTMNAISVLNNGYVGILTANPGCTLDAAGTVRATAVTSPTTGVGVELLFAGGAGYVVSYDRGAGQYRQLNITANPINIDAQGGNIWLNPNGGNVGVRTNNPVVAFQISDGNNHSIMFLPGTTNLLQSMNDTGGAWMPYTIQAGNQPIVLNPGPGGGFVGINTPSPAYCLDVGPAPGGNGNIRLQPCTGTGAGIWYDGNATSQRAFVGMETNSDTIWRVFASASGNAIGVNLTNGHVGIGTENPGSILDIFGQVGVGHLRLSVTNVSQPGDANIMEFYDTQGNSQASIQAIAENNWGAALTFWSKPQTGGAGGSTEKMRITGGGTVGIGTTNPGYGLHVFGNGENGANGYWWPNNTDTSAIFVQDGNAGYGNGGAICFGAAWASPFAAIKGFVTNGSGPMGILNFYLRPTTTDTALYQRMSLDSSGNLTITGSFFSNSGTLIGGGISTMQSVNHGLSSVYQNPYGKPLFVTVSYTLGGACTLSALVSSNNSSYTTAAVVGSVASQNTPQATYALSFWVPAAWYYYIQIGVGAGASYGLQCWTEWY